MAERHHNMDRRGVLAGTAAVLVATVAGFAVQLRHLFAKRMEFSLNATHWALYGEPIDADLSAMLDSDSRDKLLFRMAEAATRAGGLRVGLRG